MDSLFSTYARFSRRARYTRLSPTEDVVPHPPDVACALPATPPPSPVWREKWGAGSAMGAHARGMESDTTAVRTMEGRVAIGLLRMGRRGLRWEEGGWRGKAVRSEGLTRSKSSLW